MVLKIKIVQCSNFVFPFLGQYAYIESSEPRMKGDKAVMVSDLLSGQQCMQFKYHMYGEDVGSLSVYRRGILQWKESGNHGDQWLEGQVDLDCSIEEYHVCSKLLLEQKGGKAE